MNQHHFLRLLLLELLHRSDEGCGFDTVAVAEIDVSICADGEVHRDLQLRRLHSLGGETQSFIDDTLFHRNGRVAFIEETEDPQEHRNVAVVPDQFRGVVDVVAERFLQAELLRRHQFKRLRDRARRSRDGIAVAAPALR